MSGQRIDDHANWIGKPGKNMIMPEGNHSKAYASAEGAGELSKYEDTSESIHSQQEMGIRKAKGHPQKSEYRN